MLLGAGLIAGAISSCEGLGFSIGDCVLPSGARNLFQSEWDSYKYCRKQRNEALVADVSKAT